MVLPQLQSWSYWGSTRISHQGFPLEHSGDQIPISNRITASAVYNWNIKKISCLQDYVPCQLALYHRENIRFYKGKYCLTYLGF